MLVAFWNFVQHIIIQIIRIIRIIRIEISGEESYLGT